MVLFKCVKKRGQLTMLQDEERNTGHLPGCMMCTAYVTNITVSVKAGP